MFPIFLKLESRRCLVVGAGTVAAGKISGLLAEHASVRVVAPEAVDQIKDWASAGAIEFEQRPFESKDLDGAFLVIVATSSPETNTRVFQEAQAKNILCNAVDDPEHCDFYYGAVVNRGDLQIAVSTNGHSPALAQRIRRELEQQFGPEYEAWVAELGKQRKELFAAGLDPEVRKRILHDLASRPSFDAYEAVEGGSN
jgi:precorrin-2 dehydrogenase / sirohydrochlorin ferrochelatase